MTPRGRWTTALLAFALVLSVDQVSKWWVLDVLRLPERGQVVLLPFLNLTMVWNKGVTFGLLRQDGAWGPAILSGLALAVVAGLGLWVRRAENRLVAAALGAVAGGAVGNVIDRLRFGAVVDFVHAHAWGWSWYVFNVADAAIVCGVAALVLDGLRAEAPAGDDARPTQAPMRDRPSPGWEHVEALGARSPTLDASAPRRQAHDPADPSPPPGRADGGHPPA